MSLPKDTGALKHLVSTEDKTDSIEMTGSEMIGSTEEKIDILEINLKDSTTTNSISEMIEEIDLIIVKPEIKRPTAAILPTENIAIMDIKIVIARAEIETEIGIEREKEVDKDREEITTIVGMISDLAKYHLTQDTWQEATVRVY